MSKIIFTTKYLSRQHLIMGLIASFCVILFLAFQFTNVETQSKQKANMAAAGNIVNSGDSIDWKTVDLKQRSIPSHIKGSLDSSIIKDNTFTIKLDGDKKEIKLFYKECLPKQEMVNEKSITLWLLHGAAFTSKTWQDSIPTIQTICALGYRVVAIDIPGYGNTPDCQGCNKQEFMKKVLDDVIGESVKPVIVSPSMSGGWSLPFIKKYQDRIRGFVPVAPVQTSSYTDFFSTSMKVPTMIVYGENDSGLGTRSYNDLKKISTSTKPQILKDASHPAYLDQPEEWHTLLYNFLKLLE